MKNDRGQVTIPQIIIVIVLIILVVVCIFMLTGENGLFVLKGDKIENNTQNTNTETGTNNVTDTDTGADENNTQSTDTGANTEVNQGTSNEPSNSLIVPMQ